MINIVTFKWKKIKDGFQLPSVLDEYSSNHVNILYNSIKRNTNVDFKFTCVTDDPNGLDPSINYVPLWDKCKSLGGCYNRLYIYSKDMLYILGNNFVCIDIDTVIVGNIDWLLDNHYEFAIAGYPKGQRTKQWCNGSIQLIKNSSRSSVWDRFEFDITAKKIEKLNKTKEYIGSDQAWIAYNLQNEKTFDESSGFYYYTSIRNKNKLPENASIISFAGRRDPSQFIKKHSWVEENWKI